MDLIEIVGAFAVAEDWSRARDEGAILHSQVKFGRLFGCGFALRSARTFSAPIDGAAVAARVTAAPAVPGPAFRHASVAVATGFLARTGPAAVFRPPCQAKSADGCLGQLLREINLKQAARAQATI